MRARLNARAVVCLCLMVLAAGAFLQATRWPRAASLFPMVVSVPLFALALIEFAFNVFGKPSDAAEKKELSDKGIGDGHDDLLVRRHAVRVFAWCLAFFAMAVLVGFSVAVPLFVFLYLKPYCKEGWGTSLALTGVAGVCFYGLFVKLLNVRFDPGLLQQALKSVGLS